MDRDDRLHPAVEIPVPESFLHINGNQPCLPVMAVNDIRPEADNRQHGKHCLGEKRIPLNLPSLVVAVNLIAAEIMLIVNKVIMYALFLCLQDAHISTCPVKIQVKVSHIFHFILHFLLHAGILGNNDPHVKVLLVYAFRQGTHYVGQTACLDKRNSL